jgi:hypothetical protein
LVLHGPVTCARCWPSAVTDIQECGSFRLVRDPGHWGASNPHTLVLGISKGNTQSRALHSEIFDAVAFKGIRHRMLEAFQAVGILLGETIEAFDRRFSASERDFAFASVVRCSITGFDRKKRVHTADSPNILPAFKRGNPASRFVENCVDQHLASLPPRTKLVLLLSNTDIYIDALSDVIARRRGTVTRLNDVAYESRDVRFIHIAHPSKANGHFGAFIRGEGKAGKKRDLARDAVASFS